MKPFSATLWILTVPVPTAVIAMLPSSVMGVRSSGSNPLIEAIDTKPLTVMALPEICQLLAATRGQIDTIEVKIVDVVDIDPVRSESREIGDVAVLRRGMASVTGPVRRRAPEVVGAVAGPAADVGVGDAGSRHPENDSERHHRRQPRAPRAASYAPVHTIIETLHAVMRKRAHVRASITAWRAAVSASARR